MKYTFAKSSDPSLQAYGLTHKQASDMLAKDPSGIMSLDLTPVATRVRPPKAKPLAVEPMTVATPSGPTIPQTMWLAACGR